MDTQHGRSDNHEPGSEHLDDNQNDPREAIARLGGLDELYADILGRFLDDSAGTMENLRSFAAAGDLKKTREAAHSLKGVAAMCGAAGVAGVAAALERTAQSGHCEAVAQLVKRLEIELAKARQSLGAFRRPQQQAK